MPGSPGEPAPPGPPGFPFELQIVVTTKVTEVIAEQGMISFNKTDSRAVRVSLFCHQVPDGFGVKISYT